MRKPCEKTVTRKSKKREIIYALLFVMALVFPRALEAETLLIANEKELSGFGNLTALSIANRQKFGRS